MNRPEAEELAFLAAATESLQLALRLLQAQRTTAALLSIENVIGLCEEHPLYARDWNHLPTLHEIVRLCAGIADAMPETKSRACRLIQRIDEIKGSTIN